MFTREVNKGGNTYTTAIMNKLGVSFDAERPTRWAVPSG